MTIIEALYTAANEPLPKTPNVLLGGIGGGLLPQFFHTWLPVRPLCAPVFATPYWQEITRHFSCHFGLLPATFSLRLLTRCCQEYNVTAVDIMAGVIDAASDMGLPTASPHLHFVHGNFAAVVAACKQPVDILMMDISGTASDGARILPAPELSTLAFVQSIRNCLTPNGMYVQHMWDIDYAHNESRVFTALLESVFTNTVWFAGNYSAVAVSWTNDDVVLDKDLILAAARRVSESHPIVSKSTDSYDPAEILNKTYFGSRRDLWPDVRPQI